MTPSRLFLLTALCVAVPVAAQEAIMVAPGATDSSTRAPAALRGAGPNGATIRCRDGSHPAPNAPAGACDDKGGVLLRYPMLRVPARTSAPALVKAPEPPPSASPSRPAALMTAPPGSTPAGAPPADATQVCRDGTVIRVDTTAAACAARGGVGLRFRRRPR